MHQRSYFYIFNSSFWSCSAGKSLSKDLSDWFKDRPFNLRGMGYLEPERLSHESKIGLFFYLM